MDNLSATYFILEEFDKIKNSFYKAFWSQRLKEYQKENNYTLVNRIQTL